VGGRSCTLPTVLSVSMPVGSTSPWTTNASSRSLSPGGRSHHGDGEGGGLCSTGRLGRSSWHGGSLGPSEEHAPPGAAREWVTL
jgi:hypothetical protein